MARIGVFVCWCGENIARTVDVDEVARRVAEIPGVRCAVNYKYMCSDPGQAMIREKIASEQLDAVVVASCSPHMHLKHLPQRRRACGPESLPAWKWPTSASTARGFITNRAQATAKAVQIIRLSVEKVRQDHALEPIRVPVTRRALVIGGGVAGIQAALDIANARLRSGNGGAGAFDRRQDGGAFRDFPDAGLLAVHSDPAHGGSGAALRASSSTRTRKLKPSTASSATSMPKSARKPVTSISANARVAASAGTSAR